MIKGRPRLQLDTSEFRKIYTDGVPIISIASHYKISKSSVRSLRIRLNIPLRKSSRVLKIDENEYMRLFEAGTTYKKWQKS